VVAGRKKKHVSLFGQCKEKKNVFSFLHRDTHVPNFGSSTKEVIKKTYLVLRVVFDLCLEKEKQ